MKNKTVLFLLIAVCMALLSCTTQEVAKKPTTGLIISEKPVEDRPMKEEEPVFPYEQVQESAPVEVEIRESIYDVQKTELPVKDEKFYYEEGISFEEKGMYAKALESFKQSVDINHDYALAHYSLGRSYLRTNDRVSLFQTYKTLMELNPQMADSLYKDVLQEAFSVRDGYIVQIGAFKVFENATKLYSLVRLHFLNAYIEDENRLHKLRITGVRTKEEGLNLMSEIYRKFGIKPFMFEGK